MKMKSILTVLMVVLGAQNVFASVSLKDLGQCISDAQKNVESPGYGKMVDKCYDMARPWGGSNNLEGNALYARALEMYLGNASDRNGYQALADRLGDYFSAHLAAKIQPDLLESWSDEALGIVFDGVSAIDFYTSFVFPNDFVLSKFALVFEALESRHLAVEEQADSIYSAFLRVGDWAQASAILKRWPALSSRPLPVISSVVQISPNDLGYYQLSQDLNSMSLQKLDKDHGPKIIMSGYCHFAIDVVRILDNEMEISALMKQYGLVVNPNTFEDGIDIAEIGSLRSEFPNFEFHPIYSSGSWFANGIEVLNSPTILFLKDGVPRYEIPGSDPKYLVADFCRGLESVGLTAPNSCPK